MSGRLRASWADKSEHVVSSCAACYLKSVADAATLTTVNSNNVLTGQKFGKPLILVLTLNIHSQMQRACKWVCPGGSDYCLWTLP